MDSADKTQLSTGGQTSSRSTKSQSTSYVWRIVSICIRFSVWFGIFTLLFRCPSSPAELDDASPRLCRPYYDARALLAPHIRPYYDVYAAPYVEAVQPYAITLHEKVYTPSIAFAKDSYDTYGAAKVAQAQSYGKDQWQKIVIPRFEETRHGISKQYEALLAPHVSQTYGYVGPYVDKSRTATLAQYNTILVPLYQKASPYLQTAYDQGHILTTETLLPYSKSASQAALVFLQRRVWPPVRILYGENVQPQLDKIRERLASYRDGKKLEAVVNSVESSSSSSSSISSTTSKATTKSQSSSAIPSSVSNISSSSISPSSKSSSTTVTQSPSQSIVRPQPLAPKEELATWRQKFSKAADRGGEDLRSRIDQITSSQITKQAGGTGLAFLISLEETVDTSLASLKTDISRAVRKLAATAESPDDGTEQAEQAAKETTREAIRSAGKRIKDSAQHLRSWRGRYDNETASLVNSATESTLDVVDGIRDLGLQEIGMRWAALGDDVSYTDWSEFHHLRKKFDDWRGKLEALSIQHSGLEKAKKEGEQVESRGMAIAEDAARELQRLKEVGVWKIEARDISEDYSSRYGPPAVEQVKQQVLQKASDASEAVAGSRPRSSISSVSSQASSTASEATTSISENASSVLSSTLSRAESKSSELSEAASSSASDTSSRLSSSATMAPSSAPSVASKMSEDAVDGEISISSSIASKVNEAGDKFSEVTSSLGSQAAEQAQKATSKVALI